MQLQHFFGVFYILDVFKTIFWIKNLIKEISGIFQQAQKKVRNSRYIRKTFILDNEGRNFLQLSPTLQDFARVKFHI